MISIFFYLALSLCFSYLLRKMALNSAIQKNICTYIVLGQPRHIISHTNLCALAHTIHERVHFISSSASLLKCTYHLNHGREKNTDHESKFFWTMYFFLSSFSECSVVFSLFCCRRRFFSCYFFYVYIFFASACAAVAVAATTIARFLFLSL